MCITYIYKLYITCDTQIPRCAIMMVINYIYNVNISTIYIHNLYIESTHDLRHAHRKMWYCDSFMSHTWRTHATHDSFDVPTHRRVIRQGQKSPIFISLFSKRVLFSWVSFAKESYFYKSLLQKRLYWTIMCPHNDEWFVKDNRALFSWVSFAKEPGLNESLLQKRLYLTMTCPHNDEWFVKRKYSLINIMINIPHCIRIFAMANNIRTIHLYPHHSFISKYSL